MVKKKKFSKPNFSITYSGKPRASRVEEPFYYFILAMAVLTIFAGGLYYTTGYQIIIVTTTVPASGQSSCNVAPPTPSIFVTGEASQRVSLSLAASQSQGQNVCKTESFKVFKAAKSFGSCGTYSLAPQTTSNTLTISGLTNGITYCFKAQAVGIDQQSQNVYTSGDSNIVEGTPHTTIPSAPQLTVGKAGDNFITLIWFPPSDDGGSAITEYKIKRGFTSGAETNLATATGSTLTHNDTTAQNGQEYFYIITAKNIVGESNPSNEVSATPQATPDTTPPTVLAVGLANNSKNVSVAIGKISINFSEPIATATDSAITISPQENFSKLWSTDSKNLSIIFSANLSHATNYTLTIGSGLKDLSENALASKYVLMFSTELAPVVTTTSSSTTTTGATTSSSSATTATTAPTVTLETTTTTAPQITVSAEEALSVINEANSTIVSFAQTKNITDALDLYKQAVDAYNSQNYLEAKIFAEQAKSAVKEFSPQQLPIVFVAVAALILLILVVGIAYYLKTKSSAGKPEKKREEKKEETQPQGTAFPEQYY